MNCKFHFGLTAIACAVLPWAVPQHSLTILVEALIFGLFAMSLDLLVGYCRLYSFGHAAAYGLGAYSYALILTHAPLPLPAGLLLAVAVTSVVAVPIAWICTRSTGVSFAMLTLAFAQLGYAMLFRFRDLTGGSDGLVGIARHPGPFGIDWFQSKLGYYYLVLGCLLGSYLLCRAIVRSPFGAVLAGIRENEAKTIALGYNTRAYKIATVVLAYGVRRIRRRAVCRIRRLCVAGAVLLAHLGPRPHHGCCGRSRHPDRTDPRRRVVRLPRASPVAGHRSVAAHLRYHLHPLRDVCPAGHLGHPDRTLAERARAHEHEWRQGGIRCRYLNAAALFAVSGRWLPSTTST